MRASLSFLSVFVSTFVASLALAQTPQPPQNWFWYYCAQPAGYYPYVSSCPSGWHEVPAGSQVPSPSSESRKTVHPSFDCSSARTASEKLICSDESLIRADAQMADAYRKYRAQADPSLKDQIAQEQQDWVLLRDTACGLTPGATVNKSDRTRIIDCLLAAFDVRTEYLYDKAASTQH